MLSLLKGIGGSWEGSRDALFQDLEQIETVINRRWGSTFGKTNVLDVPSGGTGLTSFVKGDLLYADTTTSLARLADVATGNALLSGGVGAIPFWSKVGLTTHVSGILPIANGGTNSSTALSGTSLMMSSGTAIIQAGITTNAGGTDLVFPSITAPATPATGAMYANQTNGHTLLHWIDQDGTDLVLERDRVIIVRNTSGGPLTKGTIVDIYGATGQVPNVRPADNTDKAKHAEGILNETIANNGFGLAVTAGYVQNINTGAFVDGDVIYTGTAGAFTSTLPAFPTAKFQQRLGVIVYAHATQGIVQFEPSNYGILIDLTADVTGVLPVSNGGTGASTLTGILKGNGTSAVTAIALPADATKYLDGTGSFTVPAGGGSMSVAQVAARVSVRL